MFKFLSVILLAAQSLSLSAQNSWKCDPAHSSLRFKTTHMGLVDVWGKFKSYQTSFEQKKPTNDLSSSFFSVEVDMNSVDTEVEARDKHLRSADFLDVEKHPQMIFVSKSFKKKKGDNYQLEGSLTLKGETKPVTISAKAGKVVTDFDGKKRIGFSGTAQINRKDFGIVFNAPMDNGSMLIGDTIEIYISMEFVSE